MKLYLDEVETTLKELTTLVEKAYWPDKIGTCIIIELTDIDEEGNLYFTTPYGYLLLGEI